MTLKVCVYVISLDVFELFEVIWYRILPLNVLQLNYIWHYSHTALAHSTFQSLIWMSPVPVKSQYKRRSNTLSFPMTNLCIFKSFQNGNYFKTSSLFFKLYVVVSDSGLKLKSKNNLLYKSIQINLCYGK